MSDKEQLIQIFEHAVNKAWGEGFDYIDLSPRDGKKILELLKEREPIKPTVNVDTWVCSKCGHELESQKLFDDGENPQILLNEQYAFCPSCGREVKWE